MALATGGLWAVTFLLAHVARLIPGGRYCSGDYALKYYVDQSKEWPLEDRGRLLAAYLVCSWVLLGALGAWAYLRWRQGQYTLIS